MKPRRTRCGYAAAALLLVTTACQAAPHPEPRLELALCTLVGVDAECGTLLVPEDRTTASGRMIQLRVAVLQARGGTRVPDPFFWLAGGPGDAATNSAGAAAQLLG